jgi:hypothetical protein
MAKQVEQILSADNLTGRINKIVGGVPDNILPPGFFTVSATCEGNQTSYTKVDGTRQTARAVMFGAASVQRALQGISEARVTLLHTFEHIHHPAATLLNLRNEDNPGKQKLGRQSIARQVKTFGEYFRNLRISAVYSMLAKGAIYWDKEGNLLPSSTNAHITNDFQVPAGNKDQLDVFGDGDIFDTDWTAAGTDILIQLANLKIAARKLTGYELTTAYYGSAVLGKLLGNTAIKELINNNPSLSSQAVMGGIPDGLAGFKWVPISEAFFNDASGNNQDWFENDNIVFTPDVNNEWYEFIEGSYPIPRSQSISNDMTAALAQLNETQGAFSWAELTTDPPGIKHLGGDTFLPVLKVPGAIFIAETPGPGGSAND